ncbi:MAG: serine/threonine protein kinase [Planctomycetia bacterium]|nr:serine/threonine protein kinase [Planctomycetia bacterium]
MTEQRGATGSSVQAQDGFVLRLLGQTTAVGVERASAVNAWWLAERRAGEGLTEFLARQGVFTAAAVKTVEVMQKGYVQFADCNHLLAADAERAIDTVCQRSRARQAEPPPESQSAKMAQTPVQVASAAVTTIANREWPGRPATPSSNPREPVMTRTVALAGARTPGNSPIDVGATVGNCLITERVGKGAYGVVFRALHQNLNIPVAVKVLHAGVLEQDGGIREQLQREARLLAQLNHPNLIRVWDYHDQGEVPCMVLEYVEGLSLAELIEQSGQLRPDRAVCYLRQIADGLHSAHKLGIVHRDVKPANILIARDGSAKLADLGLALVCNEALRSSMASAAEQPGLAGTAAYIAPEQIRDSLRVDHRTDIYALGATAYHALTGKMPFRGQSVAEVIMKHMREAPVPPVQLQPQVGPLLSDIILKMLAKTPEERFQDCAELQAALQEAEQELKRAGPGSSPNLRGAKPTGDASSLHRSVWQRVLGRFSRSHEAERTEPNDR